jgi:hypothetical protein
MQSTTQYLKMKWDIFTYNYSWPQYTHILDGWIAKCALAVPIIGYLIIFNDAITDHLSFKKLTDGAAGLLSSSARLKFTYIGMLTLGAANALYSIRRPYVMRIGKDQFDYVERALQHFTVSDYIRIHGDIRNTGFDPRTRHGKYYDSEYKDFLAYSSPSSGRDATKTDFHWVDAKAKFEGLLRSMLIETFVTESAKRRKSLSLCLFLALVGYGLLLVPSLDLFFRVMSVVIRPLQS